MLTAVHGGSSHGHAAIVLVAPPRHLLAALPAISPAEVALEPLLLTEAGCAYRLRFEQSLTAVGGPQHEGLEFGSVEATKQCVFAGMGLAVFPAVAIGRELATGALMALPWAGPALNVTMKLVWHAERWYHPDVRAFLDLARALVTDPASDAGAAPRRLRSACRGGR